jgi:eukaryotic-like serine/threonine-protein kinase
MDPDRWQEVASIFQKALDAGETDRDSVLEKCCAGDATLRREVESLLAQYAKAGDFLEVPIFAATQPQPTKTLSPLPNTVVGHFRILEKIGSGGMGVVYKAEDLKLSRYVALKFLPDEVAANPQSLSRFRLEARAASALNHPCICTIYEVDEDQGRLFLAMELLEGQTLRQAIAGDPLTVATVLDFGMQIAQAMECAHSAGIVHRDLKPANIFLTQRRRIKVLDFGLAKLTQRLPHWQPANAPLTLATEAGMLLGTPGYMAPEQIRGQTIDHRVDIFAFGAILYEMLAGTRAFDEPTPAETFAAILKEEPRAISQIAPNIPPSLATVVKRCLEKDPEQRFQSASDLAFALETVSGGHGPVAIDSGSHPRRIGPRTAIAYAAGTALLAGSLALAVWLTPSPVSGPIESTQITFSADAKEAPLFTDGVRLYFQSRGVPSVMAAGGGIIAPLHILEPGMKLLDISPDGTKALALQYEKNQKIDRGPLFVANMLGGSPRKLNDHLARTARWSPDGRYLLFTDEMSLFRMDADGANLQTIWKGPGYVSEPAFSPDSQQIIINVWPPSDRLTHLWRLNADGSNAHPLDWSWPRNTDQYSGQWTPDGRHFIFLSSREGHSNVYEVVPPRWFAFWQKPTAVRITGNQVNIDAAVPARDSKSLFVLGKLEQGMMQVLDPATGKLAPFLDGLPALQFAISPDRQWMAYTEFPSGTLWKSKLDGSEKLQLTNSYAAMEQWSPDGKTLVYSDGHKLNLVSTEGGAPQKLVAADGGDEIAPTWFPDGKSIAFSYLPYPDVPQTGIRVVDVASRKVSVMPGSGGYFFSSWSPDGKWLVAGADNPPRMMLYSAAKKAWQTLKQFDQQWGYWAWANDSKSIYMVMILANQGGDMYRLTVPGESGRE